jgi:hypothetical protein
LMSEFWKWRRESVVECVDEEPGVMRFCPANVPQ